MLQIALEVPLGLFALARLGKRHDAALTGIHSLGNRRDGAALAGGIPPLDQHHQALAGLLQPPRHAVEFDLQLFQFLFVVFLL
jgi:hypothetical protein